MGGKHRHLRRTQYAGRTSPHQPARSAPSMQYGHAASDRGTFEDKPVNLHIYILRHGIQKLY